MATNNSPKVAQPHPPHGSIDTLYPCLAVVLGETGKFFRNPALHDPKHLDYTKGKLGKLIAGANQEFQDALDELEIEIVEAKAVMERDLALIRAKRAERERVAAGLKPQSPGDGETRATPQNEKVENAQTESEQSLRKELANLDSEDVIMVNGDLDTGVGGVGAEDMKIQLAPKIGDEDVAKQNADVDANHNAGLIISGEPMESAGDQMKSNKENEHDATRPVQSSGTPPVNDFQDINFESMFDDNGTTGDNDQIDFDLGFTNDTNMDEEFLNDSAFENITMSNEAAKDLNSTSNEDINTLLPGLENYVNAGDDFPISDNPAAHSVVTPYSGGMSKPTDAAAVASVEQAPLESNFDDFFASGTYMDGGGDDDMGEDGGFGDFDDSWFGTDVGKTDGS